MWASIAAWLVSQVLTTFFSWAAALIAKQKEKHDADVAQGKIDSANIAAYKAAKDRLAKQKAALDLLNGTHNP